jgi:hypothetical protein
MRELWTPWALVLWVEGGWPGKPDDPTWPAPTARDLQESLWTPLGVRVDITERRVLEAGDQTTRCENDVKADPAITPEQLRDGTIWALRARGAELFAPLEIVVRVRRPRAEWVAAGVARIDLPPP